jgi:predicted dithiol-disulfide oxidoreductase (DUF899 family)
MIQESARILSLRTKFTQARAELQHALAEDARAEVADYVFAAPGGPVALSALFGQKRDLFVIHNMGTGCNNCTMWADGFNGLYPHIADRAAFVVSSPDPPSVQGDFAAMRGWTFAMVSTVGGSFAADMGFADGTGRTVAGVSAFQMQQGKIIRVSAAGFDGADEFCAVWRLFDLLPERADGWRPKQRYR